MARSSVATDAFTYSNGNLAGKGSWAEMDGYTGYVKVLTNQIVAYGTVFSEARWNAAFADDQYSSLAVGVMSIVGSAYYIGALVRCGTGTNGGTDNRSYYGFLIKDVGGGSETAHYLVRKAAGSAAEYYNGSSWSTTVASFGTSTDWEAGDFLEIEVVGYELKCIRSTAAGGRGSGAGSPLLTLTDAGSTLASGDAGVSTYGGEALTFTGDNWEGGDITGGGSSTGAAFHYFRQQG